MRLPCAVLILAVLAACQEDAPAGVKKRADPSLARLLLEERGREPRETIRLRPVLGKERVLAVTTTSLGRTVRETVAIRLPALTSSGEPRYEATLRLVELVGAPGSDEERKLKAAQGSLASATVTRQGQVRESRIEGDEAAHALATWVRWGIVPFPDEAIGTGASWEEESDGRVTRYELAGFDGTRAVVRFREEMPASALAASGAIAQGEVVVDLTMPPPERMTLGLAPVGGDATRATTIVTEPKAP